MDLALDIASWICLVAGAIFCIIGGVGLLRLPDLYTRTHATSITDTLGAGLVLIGLLFQAQTGAVAVRLVLVLILILCTSPIAGHALVKAAASRGQKAELPAQDEEDDRTL